MPENSDITVIPAASGRSVKEFAGRLSGYFERLDARSKPLPAYTATIMGRCYAVFAALWLAFQGAYQHSAAMLPGGWWFAAFMSTSVATFVFSDRLSRNLPRISAVLQFASILIIGFSLVQSGQLEIFPSYYLWLAPALTFFPSLYLALRRNFEPLAFAGYAVALAAPIPAGVPASSPSLFFAYYFMLCLPLPLFAILRNWRYLNTCVFSWLFAAGVYYLAAIYDGGVFGRAWTFFVLFFVWYFLCIWSRIVKAPFSILTFSDFIFTVGLAVGGLICQLRVAVLRQNDILLSVVVMALVFTLVFILGRLSLGERGRSLSRIYLFIAAALLNSSIALLWPGEIALGLYCLQATLLFWLGSVFNMMHIKAGGFILLLLTPVYFFIIPQNTLAGFMFIAVTSLLFAYIQDRELKRLARRSGRKPWSSRLEFLLVAYGFVWCFAGLAVFSFREMPSPGLIYFALSSACAYLFFALGKFFRLRSLRTAIFIPMFIAVPAAVLPFIYQTHIEWPDFAHLVSYNYLSGPGAVAWIVYFVTVWTALYHNWGGLISKRVHAWFLALVTLELVLVLTSSSRAFALESGVSPSLLSVLAVLPSLACVFVISRIIKFKKLEKPYRTPLFLVVPWILFVALALWFVSSLSSPGSAAPGGKYIPLLNPVELVQLGSILIFAYWQRRLHKFSAPLARCSDGMMLWVYAVSSFLWLHGVMLRVVQYFSRAELSEVVNFVELRIIFVCIWITYGILVWIGATIFASTFSWFIGALLLAAGASSLIYLAMALWGQFVAVVIGVSSLVVIALLIWRSPLPFTQRGKKVAEQGY